MATTTKALARRQRALFVDLEQAGHLPPGSIDINGLKLTDPEMGFTDWQDLGRILGHADRWTRFALGDWLVWGEKIFGEPAAQGVESTRAERYDIANRFTGLKPDTLKNYVRVCDRVSLGRRRVELPFSTHEAVAALEPDEQAEWLQRAVDEEWGRQELRDAINAAGGVESGGKGAQQVLPAADGPSLCERIKELNVRLYHQAQPAGGGIHHVPSELIAQLGAVLGEE